MEFENASVIPVAFLWNGFMQLADLQKGAVASLKPYKKAVNTRVQGILCQTDKIPDEGVPKVLVPVESGPRSKLSLKVYLRNTFSISGSSVSRCEPRLDYQTLVPPFKVFP